MQPREGEKIEAPQEGGPGKPERREHSAPMQAPEAAHTRGEPDVAEGIAAVKEVIETSRQKPSSVLDHGGTPEQLKLEADEAVRNNSERFDAQTLEEQIENAWK